MFGFNEKPKVPLRHRKSPYMNLAYQKLPTLHGNWGTDPAPLKALTNGDIHTPISTTGAKTGSDTVYVQIDLGQVYEVYEIIIHTGYGYYHTVTGNTGSIKLKTGLTSTEADATERDEQTNNTDDYISFTLHYEGEGIPVRYVFLTMVSDGSHPQYIKPAEIEVFGC
ncbi:MAG: discoidin domain-containing protein [Methanophagales archaeon]|nr:discoidin domain-containing protein [Methanophagales archaeon]